MTRWLALLAILSLPAAAQDRGAGAAATRAAADLQSAIEAMEEAEGARDRIAALTRTIRAYEEGLVALRDAQRLATIRDAAMQMQFDARRDRLTQLLGVLMTMEKAPGPGPVLLLHPAGALATARSGMMLAEVTPALQAEVETLRLSLEEARDLRAWQAQATAILTAGLTAAQRARTALGQAVAERTDLPRRFTADPEAMRSLLEGADTLEAFAAGLAAQAVEDTGVPDFALLKGQLPLPVRGTVLRRPGEADAAGVRRPGLVLATGPRALVTNPVAATIRYRGPLLDYGNVMVLEPGGGYLLILAGLETVYGDAGEVIAAGAAVGLMGGAATDVDFTQTGQGGADTPGSATIYVEVRQGEKAVDPTEWFTGMQEQDKNR